MSTPAELVEQLHEVIDRLTALPHDTHDALSPAQRHELMVALQRESSRLGVVVADVVPAWEASGAWAAGGTLRPELAVARDARRDRHRVRYELRRARALAEMPVARQAVLEGRISMDHVDLLVRHRSTPRADLFRGCEEWLVGRCEGRELFDDAARDVRYWAMWADDQLGVRREPTEPSTLYASRAEVTGEVLLDGRLSPVDGEIVRRELQRLSREILLEDRAAGVQRTPAQRRAAALVRMAARSVNATGVTARPLFEVIVGDETARHLCELASGVVVPPEDLSRHIDHAVMQSFLFDGRHTVVATSTQRSFTGALRRAVQVRDRRCTHRSVCPTPASECGVDHRRPAARGGRTSQFSGAAECPTHNRHPDLHGHPEPLPERELTVLDQLRATCQWVARRLDSHPDDLARSGPF